MIVRYWIMSAMIAAVAAFVTVTMGSASAQVGAAEPPGDVSQGRVVADRLCASCHAVDPAGTVVARPDIPTFSAIAASPRTTPERLAGAIILPHPAMPQVALTRREIKDVIAYIMTLKDRR